MAIRALYIAAYDIRHARRLRAGLRVLKDYALGGQKSVFECFLSDGERNELLARMGEVIDSDEDRFVLLRLDPRSRVQVLGIAVEPTDPDYFYVG